MTAEEEDLASLAGRTVSKSCRPVLAPHCHIHCLVLLELLAQLEAEMVLHLRPGVGHSRYRLVRVTSLGLLKQQAVG